MNNVGDDLDPSGALSVNFPMKTETRTMAITQQLNLRNLAARFIACLRDDRGAVMAEYLIITAIMIPLAAYLYHPDNGLFKAFRDQYDRTTDLLMFFGP
jgi:hypothetical protein